MPSTKRTAALWHLDEPDGVWPSDSAGNVADLVAPAGLTAPSRAIGIVGYGRVWAAARGLKGAELVVDSTKLRRSMAVEALVFPNGDGTRLICQRGANTGTAAERVLWGLKLLKTGTACTLQMYWQKTAGSAATIAGRTFTQVTDWLYLAGVRRWVSAGSVAVDYYVNGEYIGSQTSTDGDIDGGDGGTVFIGVNDGAGTPATGMVSGDIIDEIRISADERTAEELRQVFRRLFVFPALGGELVRAFLPPGGAYSRDPSSVVQRELSVEGDGLANAWHLVTTLEEDFLPDRATETLEHWESVLGLIPGPGDGYSARRTRALSHLQTIHGFSRQKIADAIAPLLGVTAAQIVFTENKNRIGEDFGAALTSAWVQITGNGTAPAVAAGALTLAFASGAHDCRWTTAVDGAPRVIRGIGEQEETEVYAKITSLTLPNTNDEAGIVIAKNSGSLPDHHVLGVARTGGGLVFVSDRVLSGVQTIATYAAAPATPFILRTRIVGSTAEMSYGSTFDGPWTVVQTVGTIPICAFAGVGLVGGGAAPASSSSAVFDEVRVWMPRLTSVFRWLVTSSPAPPTGFNPAPAQALVNRLKPAHTEGIVAGTVFLCDDPLSLTDATLLGS